MNCMDYHLEPFERRKIIFHNLHANFNTMKTGFILSVCFLLAAFTACEKKGNQELYDEVMAIHDEVMPKMNDIHRYKKDFQAELANSATITEARKTQLESSIVMLDSAGEGMMRWMRKFDPIADSEGEEKARK